MTPAAKPCSQRVGGVVYTLTVEQVASRWYAEARHLGVLYAAGRGDTAGEALAFVRGVLDELAGAAAA